MALVIPVVLRRGKRIMREPTPEMVDGFAPVPFMAASVVVLADMPRLRWLLDFEILNVAGVNAQRRAATATSGRPLTPIRL